MHRIIQLSKSRRRSFSKDIKHQRWNDIETWKLIKRFLLLPSVEKVDITLTPEQCNSLIDPVLYWKTVCLTFAHVNHGVFRIPYLPFVFQLALNFETNEDINA